MGGGRLGIVSSRCERNGEEKEAAGPAHGAKYNRSFAAVPRKLPEERN